MQQSFSVVYKMWRQTRAGTQKLDIAKYVKKNSGNKTKQLLQDQLQKKHFPPVVHRKDRLTNKYVHGCTHIPTYKHTHTNTHTHIHTHKHRHTLVHNTCEHIMHIGICTPGTCVLYTKHTCVVHQAQSFGKHQNSVPGVPLTSDFSYTGTQHV